MLASGNIWALRITSSSPCACEVDFELDWAERPWTEMFTVLLTLLMTAARTCDAGTASSSIRGAGATPHARVQGESHPRTHKPSLTNELEAVPGRGQPGHGQPFEGVAESA